MSNEMKKSDPELRGVFECEDGIEQIAAVLRSGVTLCEAPDAAAVLARKGKLLQLINGQHLIDEGSVDHRVWFVLSGEVAITVHGKRVATRKPGEILGEIAMLEPSPKRTATVIAEGSVDVLAVSKRDFERAATCVVWKGLAHEISQRLSERNKFVPKGNQKPRVFFGSSAEKLDVLNELVAALQYDVDGQPWTVGFAPGALTIQQLQKHVEQSDFAIFVYAADDQTTMRGTELLCVRDNVIFETGMFAGALGHDRVFCVRDRSQKVHVPTDLEGVVSASYSHDNACINVNGAVAEIKKVIKTLGLRPIKTYP